MFALLAALLCSCYDQQQQWPIPAGEYVAAEKIEAAYKKSRLVEQIWVYGNSLESTLVAVVVPTGTQPLLLFSQL